MPFILLNILLTYYIVLNSCQLSVLFLFKWCFFKKMEMNYEMIFGQFLPLNLRCLWCNFIWCHSAYIHVENLFQCRSSMMSKNKNDFSTCITSKMPEIPNCLEILFLLIMWNGPIWVTAQADYNISYMKLHSNELVLDTYFPFDFFPFKIVFTLQSPVITNF